MQEPCFRWTTNQVRISSQSAAWSFKILQGLVLAVFTVPVSFVSVVPTPRVDSSLYAIEQIVQKPDPIHPPPELLESGAWKYASMNETKPLEEKLWMRLARDRMSALACNRVY